MITPTVETLDLGILTQPAKQEVIDFYYFLVQKYPPRKEVNELKMDDFFSKHNLDFTAFKFNREAANER